jgi:autotransporter passenger strand-loop-strand repeat protein
MIAIRQPHRSGVTVLFGGTEVVPSGGTASNTVASSGGVLVVLSRGLADQTTIYSGGSETVSSGGTVHDIAVSSGGALDVAGSTTSKVTVSSGGVETISSGGIAGGVANSGTLVSGLLLSLAGVRTARGRGLARQHSPQLAGAGRQLGRLTPAARRRVHTVVDYR